MYRSKPVFRAGVPKALFSGCRMKAEQFLERFLEGGAQKAHDVCGRAYDSGIPLDDRSERWR
jgi:hypothetical protein